LDENKNILEYSICNFPTNIFWGQANSSRRRRNMSKSFGKIKAKYHEFKIKFTYTATLGFTVKAV